MIAKLSELLLLELLHRLLFKFDFIFLGLLLFENYNLAIDELVDFTSGTIAVNVVGGKQENFVIGHNRHNLTLDLLVTFRYRLRGMRIADGEQAIALCTAVKRLTDGLDKIFR